MESKEAGSSSIKQTVIANIISFIVLIMVLIGFFDSTIGDKIDTLDARLSRIEKQQVEIRDPTNSSVRLPEAFYSNVMDLNILKKEFEIEKQRNEELKQILIKKCRILDN